MDTYCSARCGVPRGRILTLAVLLPAVVAIIVAAVASRTAVTATPGPLPSAALDPRLVLHASRVLITGVIDGTALHGTLYPGFPGTNSIEITMAAPHASPPDARLDLTASMPGMQMVPTKAQFAWRAGAYRGTIALPMFGTYTARLTLTQAGVHTQGTALLTLPLSLGG